MITARQVPRSGRRCFPGEGASLWGHRARVKLRQRSQGRGHFPALLIVPEAVSFPLKTEKILVCVVRAKGHFHLAFFPTDGAGDRSWSCGWVRIFTLDFLAASPHGAQLQGRGALQPSPAVNQPPADLWLWLLGAP